MLVEVEADAVVGSGAGPIEVVTLGDRAGPEEAGGGS
jgi:hypothetical protein